VHVIALAAIEAFFAMFIARLPVRTSMKLATMLLSLAVAFLTSSETASARANPGPTAMAEFTPMRFLVGYWNCVIPRPGRPALLTTDAYAFSQDGDVLTWNSLALDSAFGRDAHFSGNAIMYHSGTRQWSSVPIGGTGGRMTQWNIGESDTHDVWLSTTGTLFRKVSETEMRAVTVGKGGGDANGGCKKV